MSSPYDVVVIGAELGSVNVNLLLPPRQSRGVSYGTLVAGGACFEVPLRRSAKLRALPL